MGWKLTDFSVSDASGMAHAFSYEVTLGKPENKRIVRGDGLVLQNNRVFFNRKDQLTKEFSQLGVNADHLMVELEKQALAVVNPPNLISA